MSLKVETKFSTPKQGGVFCYLFVFPVFSSMTLPVYVVISVLYIYKNRITRIKEILGDNRTPYRPSQL